MKVVIIGGGFAGLKLARGLNNKQGIDVTLIDKINYHQFQPLFYQVATASLEASNISFPLRKVFQQSKNVKFRLAEVKEIISSSNKIITNIGEFNYDYLVIATGANTNFFGNEQLQQACYPMKSTQEALQLRNHLLKSFENALQQTDTAKRQAFLNVVVVGAGPTGVEVSGALAEMRNHILPKDYVELDFNLMNIYLVEGSPRTLATMSEESSKHSKTYLEKLGVKVITATVVKSYDGEIVELNNGNKIEARTVIWAAGIKGNIPEGIDKNLIVRGNRIKVNRFNLIEGTTNIFALGDVSYMGTPLYPHGHPQVANVAINQAKNLAENFISIQQNKKLLKEFEYNDKGSMATVGRNLAVVDIPKPKLHFGGLLAWIIWMSLHLFLLVGVKNRLQVFINWMFKYFTKDTNLRLIINSLNKKETANNINQ
ncbi:MAG: NAD(P)/FAD-dependent oxidoreductase [Bacteroidetes bacterium]|nr:NAD(P)/FAD-dependent oxidoreductase [Bacteroidota bacterium]MBS1672169.1 NAD(P)/FAD-dependent oxidoreductase [Bacteroidota bacterium]